MLVVLPVIEVEPPIKLLYWHLLIELVSVAWGEALLVAERLLEILWNTHLLWHLPLHVRPPSTSLLIVEKFTLHVTLELLIVLILIKLLVGFALVGLSLHLLLLLLY